MFIRYIVDCLYGYYKDDKYVFCLLHRKSLGVILHLLFYGFWWEDGWMNLCGSNIKLIDGVILFAFL